MQLRIQSISSDARIRFYQKKNSWQSEEYFLNQSADQPIGKYCNLIDKLQARATLDRGTDRASRRITELRSNLLGVLTPSYVELNMKT